MNNSKFSTSATTEYLCEIKYYIHGSINFNLNFAYSGSVDSSANVVQSLIQGIDSEASKNIVDSSNSSISYRYRVYYRNYYYMALYAILLF